MEMIKVDRHIGSCSIAQELKIDQKTVSNNLHKAEFKKIRCLGSTQIYAKNMLNRIFICEALVKRNKMDQFLKKMVIVDEKWITNDNIVRKRSWSKRGEAAQTVARPGLMPRKVLLCILWDLKGIIYY